MSGVETLIIKILPEFQFISSFFFFNFIIMVKRFLLLLVSIFFINSLFCQNQRQFDELKKFSNFGITFGGLVYRAPTVADHYGYYSLKPIPAMSYCFGVTYNLPIYNNWSIETGLLFANEKSLVGKVHVEEADIQGSWIDGSEFTIWEPMNIIPSIPLLVNYNINIFKKNYLNFQIGMKTFYLIPTSTIYNTANVDHQLNPNFLLSVRSHDNAFHGSFVYGIGYNIDCKHVLLKFKLNHSINFQNTYEGEYQFVNLIQHENSGGSYKLSGDYLSLTLTAHFKKIKYWKKNKSENGI